jgi:hypothetical protein
MDKVENDPAKEIATVKDKYGDNTLISLGEAFIEGKQYIVMRGGDDKVIFVEPKTLKIF